MKKTSLSAFVLFLCLAFASQAQTLKSVAALEKKYADCVSPGYGFLDCSNAYYDSMDDLLNEVYNKLRSQMTPAQKNTLKAEQLKWLAKRDAYFKKLDQRAFEAIESGSGGDEMERSAAISDKAEYVKIRVKELIQRLPK